MSKILLSGRSTRFVAWVSAALLVMTALLPGVFLSSRADAYTGDYVTTRSITMETSEASATDVYYDVSFDLATAHTVASVVLQFCDDSPLIGDTCAVTRSASGAGTFDWNDSAYAAGASNDLGAATVDAANSSPVKWILDVDTPAAMSIGDTVHIILSSVVNPNVTNSSFYVRLLTFDNATNAETYVAGTDTNVVDAGGIALSTANTITVTAKVQETLTFCVYTGVDCAAGGSAVALGDSNGVLNSAAQYTNDDAQFDLATNGQSGAKVYMSGDLLESGANDIDAIGSSCTLGANGTEQFGFRVTDNTTANTNVDPTAPYDCAAGNFSFATADLDPTSTTSPYGDEIAGTTVPTTTEDSAIEFVGNIDLTTPAGIYTATYDLVASATF